MKIGILGETQNLISWSMLKNFLDCPEVEILWFVDSGISEELKTKLYGKKFDFLW